ncbi:MAG: hypothetical protein H6845_01880 [Alphaproteobacteria bacterium]|nr:MAG: hypothetical protein H6845_01880 [Alphaproteobacteria bacterium]
MFYGALHLKAKILIKLQKYDQAIEIINKIYTETGSSEALFDKLMYSLMYRDKLEKNFLFDVEQYRKQNPADNRVQLLLAKFYLKNKNRGAFLLFKAEYAISINHTKRAKTYLTHALKILAKNSVFYLRSMDLYQQLAKS